MMFELRFSKKNSNSVYALTIGHHGASGSQGYFVTIIREDYKNNQVEYAKMLFTAFPNKKLKEGLKQICIVCDGGGEINCGADVCSACDGTGWKK